MEQGQQILISVVIVNYKVPLTLTQALQSLGESDLFSQTEVIVVDNASNDGSQEHICGLFPTVKWIQLKENIGFGKACNIGAKNAAGSHLLILNPDTLVPRTALRQALDFMRAHPDAGLVGPKLLNPDGSLQPGCRRGFPTPAAAFFHFSGLSRLFPKSRLFGHYNQTFLSPDESYPIDAISGSFMVIPKALFEKIGGFDEQFFMYGEDLDLCWRVKEAGFKVWYHPEIKIIHLKGKSSAKRLIKSRIAFYQAMVLFSKKYQHLHGAFFPEWLIYLGIVLQAGMNIGLKSVQAFTAGIIDLAIINTVFFGALQIRFGSETLYNPANALVMVTVHAMLSVSFLFMFAYNGIYSRKRQPLSKIIFSGFFASILFMACVYFISAFAFSRIAFAIAAGINIVFLAAWRELGPRFYRQFQKKAYPRERAVIVGNGHIASRLIKNIESQRGAIITGIISSGEEATVGQFEGYPVLGSMEEIASILKKHKVDMVLIATSNPWYSFIIEALALVKAKDLVIRWVPREMFDVLPEKLPETVPLHDFSV